MTPIDAPEMKKTATFILDRIQRKGQMNNSIAFKYWD
jgi:hypothetical protein